jgi:hypothetical protein
MHQKEENITENLTTPAVLENYTKQSVIEENSSLEKNKNEGRNLRSEKSQDYIPETANEIVLS